MYIKLIEGIVCIIVGVFLFVYQVKSPSSTNTGGIAVGMRLFIGSIALIIIGIYFLLEYFG